MSPFKKIGGLVGVAAAFAATGVLLINNGGGGPTGTGLYHQFLSLSGTLTCTHDPIAEDYTHALAGNHVCSSPSKAYNAAQCGEAVGMEPGNYPGFALTGANGTAKTCASTGNCQYRRGLFYPSYGPSPITDYSGCVTFEPDGGGTPRSCAVQITGPNARETAIGLPGMLMIGLPYVRIKNMCVNDPNTTGKTVSGLQITWLSQEGGTACTTTAPQPHDIVVDGVKVVGATLAMTSVTTTSVINSEFTGGIDAVGSSEEGSYILNNTVNGVPMPQGQCVSATYPSLTQTQLNGANNAIDFNYIHDQIEATPPGPHIDGLHIREMNDFEIIGNRIQNVPQFQINIESQGLGTGVRNLDNFVVVLNVLDKPCSNQTLAPPNGSGTCVPLRTLALLCHSSSADTITNGLIAYNTVNGYVSLENSGVTCGASAFAGIVVLGNVESQAATTCNLQGAIDRYNTYGSGTCDAATEISVPNPWTNPAFPAYDYSLLAGSAAINFVPTSVTVGAATINCPPTDIAGNVRPHTGNANCAAGALEP